MDTAPLRDELARISQALNQPNHTMTTLHSIWDRLSASARTARRMERAGLVTLASRWDDLADRVYTALMACERTERQHMAGADYPPRPTGARCCFECWLAGRRIWQIRHTPERSLVAAVGDSPDDSCTGTMVVGTEPPKAKTAIWRCPHGHELRHVYGEVCQRVVHNPLKDQQWLKSLNPGPNMAAWTWFRKRARRGYDPDKGKIGRMV